MSAGGQRTVLAGGWLAKRNTLVMAVNNEMKES
jgi:hypothetical protein